MSFEELIVNTERLLGKIANDQSAGDDNLGFPSHERRERSPRVAEAWGPSQAGDT